MTNAVKKSFGESWCSLIMLLGGPEWIASLFIKEQVRGEGGGTSSVTITETGIYPRKGFRNKE